ncbi:MAG: hypothetical protein V5A62_01390 [Haloarculaceae archaeon]
MSLQFVRAKPVQACKLGVIVAVLLFAAGGVFGVIPGRGLTDLFLVVGLGVVLVLVVAAETLLAGYRFTRTDTALPDRLTDRPIYTVARAIEAVSVVLVAGGFVLFVTELPDEPPAGPGAIGVLFVVAGLGVVVLGGSLVRTLAEYYYHRRDDGE